MKVILAMSKIFNIFNSIVGFASIFVIYFFALWTRAEKSVGYKAMHQVAAMDSCIGKSHLKISYRMSVLLDWSAERYTPSIGVVSNPPNIAMIANLIKCFIPDYWKPTFCFHVT